MTYVNWQHLTVLILVILMHLHTDVTFTMTSYRDSYVICVISWDSECSFWK